MLFTYAVRLQDDNEIQVVVSMNSLHGINEILSTM